MHARCGRLQERVEKAGGQVLYWNGHRVMGVLAMSRAIGDHCLRPYVIPEPEVRAMTARRPPVLALGPLARSAPQRGSALPGGGAGGRCGAPAARWLPAAGP
jgi:hypothetical protein